MMPLRLLPVAWWIGTATAIPSGTLWIPTAMAMGIPSCGSSSAEMKVAKPSGKLCSATAAAVISPVRASVWLRAASACGRRSASCGFTFSGTSRSMMPVNTMPPKKAATDTQAPRSLPKCAASRWFACGSISTMEM